LKLTRVELSDNKLANIEQLKQLEQVEILKIQNNELINVESLKPLKKI